ncbi:MAG: RDD family protein [Hyphomicrobiales bacterium]|nr:RDD family protein [Hyphomicrobiales bacterium]
MQDRAIDTLAYEENRKYAKLSVRIRAVIYDSMVFFFSMIVAVTLAIAVDSDFAAKFVGAIWVLFILLYEPLMVSIKGGTIGHIVCNTRVVDEHTLGNPSLLKASARFLIKTILGWISLVTVTASKRKKAVHDLLTGSSVQARNANKMKVYDFTLELNELSKASILKRIIGIVIYSIALIAILIGIIEVTYYFDLMSFNCIEYDRCAFSEYLLFFALNIGWLLAEFEIIAFGWRGRLYGFRAR